MKAKYEKTLNLHGCEFKTSLFSVTYTKNTIGGTE